MVTPMHGRARYALRSRLPRLTWLRLQGVPLFAIAEGPGPDHGQPSAGHSVQHLQDLVPAALVCCPRLRLPPRFLGTSELSDHRLLVSRAHHQVVAVGSGKEEGLAVDMEVATVGDSDKAPA